MKHKVYTPHTKCLSIETGPCKGTWGGYRLTCNLNCCTTLSTSCCTATTSPAACLCCIVCMHIHISAQFSKTTLLANTLFDAIHDVTLRPCSYHGNKYVQVYMDEVCIHAQDTSFCNERPQTSAIQAIQNRMKYEITLVNLGQVVTAPGSACRPNQALCG